MPTAPKQPTVPRPDWIEVAGFKSLRAPARLELRRLTLLAGANSGGKSSIIQPLLLMKQTLEAAYDPGPLLLDGRHAQFTTMQQLLSRGRNKRDVAAEFSVTFGPMPGPPHWSSGRSTLQTPVRVRFPGPAPGQKGYRLRAPIIEQASGDRWLAVSESMSVADFTDLVALADPKTGDALRASAADLEVRSLRDSPSLMRAVVVVPRDQATARWQGLPLMKRVAPMDAPAAFVGGVLHLPGLRGHRERRYHAAQVNELAGVIRANGPFTHYTASVLERWQDAQDEANLTRVFEGLRATGLTWKASAKRANASELELKVGRTATARQGGANDLVDIADVGFGVSQVLPVIVALAAAAPGQMVYVEQPELHLHPRAQLAVGRLLAEAASRGVCVVAETHSRLILRAVQIELARGELLKPDDVGLHWFSRDADTGESTVRLATVDDRGAFGDWPVDFSDVDAAADDDWLGLVLGRDST